MKKTQKVNKEKHFSHSYISGILLLAGIILCNLGFDRICYQNYQDKMMILNRMILTDEHAKLDTAIELLRSNEKQPLQMLQDYGYVNSLNNRYYTDFRKQCIAAAVCSVIFLIVFLIVAFLRKKQRRTALEMYLRQLGHCVIGFREDKKTGQRHPEPEEHTQKFPLMPGFEAEVSYVNDQLEMLEEELQLMREQSKEEKEKTKRLVTDLSHQLKTPVAALDTCFTVLEEPALSPAERAEFYQRCRNELDGLKALLDALIRISQMEAEMIRIVPEQAEIMDTLILAVNRIYPKASAKQIGFMFDYDHETEIERLAIMQDQKWLCEAFINLLDNAVKYSPAGSSIQIGIQKQTSFVRIGIADQGIGIPKKEQHKIFRRFYRGSDPRVQKESGSGVGLYLVRMIIEEHHGTVSVRTGIGREKAYPGSVFVVHLPLRE